VGSDPGPAGTAPPPLFALRAVTVRRGDAVLLDAVSADIHEGACTAVAGYSGSGKSTLLRLLNRFVDPSTGTVAFCGAPLNDHDVLRLRRRVGLVAQQPVLLADRVADDLRVGRPDLTDAGAAALMSQVGLPAAMLSRRTDGLSGGEAQRVCLARALAVEPEVLLLDEPTSSLDPASAAAVEDVVRELVRGGRTAVLVSHDAGQARRIADQVLVLRRGALVETGPANEVGYLRISP
jgi:putative ABC transport system ATP-binding protein